MDNKLLEFFYSVGALTETWTMVYHNFMNQGFDKDEALTHTSAFIKVVLTSGMDTENKEKGKGDEE